MTKIVLADAIVFVVLLTTIVCTRHVVAWQPVSSRVGSSFGSLTLWRNQNNNRAIITTAATPLKICCEKVNTCLAATVGATGAEVETAAALPQSTQFPEAIASTPLPEHSFAGMVEAGMKELYGQDGRADDIERVLQSWRLVEADYVHKEYHGPTILDSDDNPAEASACHQLCHSYVPGLTVREFWDTKDFVWCQELQSKYKAIRNEFLKVTDNMEALQRKGNNIWAGALTDDAGSYGKGWRTLVLMNRGQWDPVNTNLFPVTAKAVRDSGCPAVEVFFASMKGGSKIEPHTDFTNFVLTSHLGVKIPASGENKCRLTVGDTTNQWLDGDVMLFDTSIQHDAINESDETRYILMLRVWHPDLSEKEKGALQFIYDCLEYPDLASRNDPAARQRAEEQVAQAKAFPLLKKGAGLKDGFGASGQGASKKVKSKKKKKKKK